MTNPICPLCGHPVSGMESYAIVADGAGKAYHAHQDCAKRLQEERR